MSSSDQENRERNRQIADNEAERQIVGAARVSIWAIAVAVIVGVICVAGLASPSPRSSRAEGT